MPPGWKEEEEAPRLDQMVSLAISKGKPIKKMMHVPSVKIYCVKEVPINSRSDWQQLKKLLANWEDAIEQDRS
jgi:hypothetical protein